MRRLAAALMGATLALAACVGGNPDPTPIGTIDDIIVGTDDNGAPTISFLEGAEFVSNDTIIEWEGDGETIERGNPLLLDFYVVSLATGDVIRSTHDGSDGTPALPVAKLAVEELIGTELAEALIGQREGVRVLHIAPSAEEYVEFGPVAMVVDSVHSRAHGQPQGARDDMPIVGVQETGEPLVTLRDLEPPTELQSHVLIRGDGEQVRVGSWIQANYVAMVYETGEIWRSTWAPEVGPWEFQIGRAEPEAIEGIEQGLIDVAEGTQIILLIPPYLAYGENSLVFVIDVLSVWNGEAI